MQEADATNLTNAVMDREFSSSLYYVLGLTMTDESKSLKTVPHVSVEEGATALHKILAEHLRDIVNGHLGLLKTTMSWAKAIRTTYPITAIIELNLRMTACDL